MAGLMIRKDIKDILDKEVERFRIRRCEVISNRCAYAVCDVLPISNTHTSTCVMLIDRVAKIALERVDIRISFSLLWLHGAHNAVDDEIKNAIETVSLSAIQRDIEEAWLD